MHCFCSGPISADPICPQPQDLQAKIEDLKMSISTLTKELDTLKSEIAEMQVLIILIIIIITIWYNITYNMI